MPITSVDTTNVTLKCPWEGNTEVFAIASLEAGSIAGKGTLRQLIAACNHVWQGVRTYNNFTVLAGAINGLHKHLVGLGQTNAAHTAALAAETDGDRPDFFYVITGTAITPKESTVSPGWFDRDTAALLANLPSADLQSMVLNGTILLSGDDSEISAFTTSLFAAPSDRAEQATKLKTLRDVQFP